MKMNCGYSVNKGQSSALLVPASATRMAASPYKKDLRLLRAKGPDTILPYLGISLVKSGIFVCCANISPLSCMRKKHYRPVIEPIMTAANQKTNIQIKMINIRRVLPLFDILLFDISFKNPPMLPHRGIKEFI